MGRGKHRDDGVSPAISPPGVESPAGRDTLLAQGSRHEDEISADDTQPYEAEDEAGDERQGMGTTHAFVHAGTEPGTEDRGKRFGRFTVLSTLGSGAMGKVYAAYDDRLDRRVAIKVLRASAASAAGRGRLLREAQAMAKVSHPNVVGIFEVGELEKNIFIAMEFVDGPTLTQWLEREKASLEEILRVFRSAGAGLEAAHRAGLIHRDFKPDNTLLSKDGRVRVADFGLVGSGESAPEMTSRVDISLTQTGAILGTPLYMAPEQFRGNRVDARADQFSFCVSLYEALCGKPPFEGDSFEDLQENVMKGQPPPFAEELNVPPFVKESLKRGLEIDPARRFPSMTELLAALTPVPKRRRRKWPWVAAAAFVLGISASFAIGAGRDSNKAPAAFCESSDAEFDDTWNPEIRERIRESFLATKDPLAEPMFKSFSAGLDEYAAKWKSMRRGACEATHVRHEQSTDLLDLRMACFDTVKVGIKTLTSELAKADKTALRRSVTVVRSLTTAEICNDIQSLRAGQSPRNPEAVAQAPVLSAELARAKALRLMGQTKQAAEIAQSVEVRAEKLKWTQLQADALALRGDLADRAGLADEALEFIEKAAVMAVSANAPRIAAEAFTSLVWTYGYAKRDLEKATHYAELAEAFIKAAGNDDALLAQLRNYQGLAMQYADKPKEALVLYQEALALTKKSLGPEHHRVAMVLNDLGSLERRQGDFDSARQHHKTALEIRIRSFGEAHPYTVSSLINLANVDTVAENYEKSLATMTRASAVAKRVYPDAHPRIGLIEASLGEIQNKRKKYDLAVPHLEKALVIFSKRLGPAHRDSIDTRQALAEVFVHKRDFRAAHEQLDAAIEATKAAKKPDENQMKTLLTAKRELRELERRK